MCANKEMKTPSESAQTYADSQLKAPPSCRDYIGRVNLYRQRVWTCKATGKTNLTYEEALLSEQRANEKIQQFPKAYIKPVLELVQFSKWN
jgi:hypothetical protein